MPPRSPGAVSAHVDLRLVQAGDPDVLVPCRLEYDAGAPYEISATFATADGDVTWVFARDLVRAGLGTPSGQGDVVVWPSRSPSGEVVCLALSSPSGRALLEADRGDLVEFLTRADELVAPGTESIHLDLDAVVQALLDEQPD